MATAKQGIHEGSLVKVTFSLYWYDGSILGGEEFMGRVDFDGGHFDAPNFQQGPLPDGDGLQLGIEANLVLQHFYPPGTEFAAMEIGLVEDDGQTADDDVLDIDPGNDGDIDITVDLKTGMFTGEMNSGGCVGCQFATAGNPGDGSNGIIFSVTVENECVGQVENPTNGVDDDCDNQIDELPCCCGNGETCDPGPANPFCSSDRDGDSLLDIWEIRGFDADCTDGDNAIDVDLPSWGVSPDHKDILVEIDHSSRGSEPTQAMVLAAKAMFRRAPIYAGGIDNPDGKPGINLWIDNGPRVDPFGLEPGPTAGRCDDGIDNDNNGLTDENDPNCLWNYGMEGVALCTPGVDGDNDGLPAEMDPDCDVAKVPEGHGTCGDGIDNNLNGATDTADAACRVIQAIEGAGRCNDGVDDDLDGLIDAMDPDCRVGDDLRDLPGDMNGGGQHVGPASLPKGSNIDAHFQAAKDIFFDFANRELFFHYMLTGLDFDATRAEGGAVAKEGGMGDDRSCEDHADNDGDGFVDMEDTDCTTCINGVDDDMDTLPDGADSDCFTLAHGGAAEFRGNDLYTINSDIVSFSGGQRLLNRRMSGPPPVYFVHELGHNLGLLHGGSSALARDPAVTLEQLSQENKNCKPNHVSVMNYQWTEGLRQTGFGARRQDTNRNLLLAGEDSIVDYWPPAHTGGRSDFTSVLNESALLETSVIDPANPNALFAFNTTTARVAGQDLNCGGFMTDGVVDGIDWNGDCMISPTPIAFNIDTLNGASNTSDCDGESGISPEPLIAENDWRNLIFNFRDYPDGAPSAIAFGAPVPEPGDKRERRALRIAEHATTLDLTATSELRTDGLLELSVQVENLGPKPSVATYLTLPLPSGTSLVESSAAECAEFLDGTVVCALGRAEVGEIFALTLVLNVEFASCELTLFAENAADETRQGDVSLSAACGVDVSITLGATPNPVPAGGALAYHVNVANAGPDSAENVVVSLVLPAGTTYQGSTVSCAEGPVGTLSCPLGSLQENESAAFDVSVVVAPDLVFLNGGPVTITGAASVTSSTEPELNAANNVANVATLVNASADLELVSMAAVSPPTELVVGSSVNVVVNEVVTNRGLSSPINAQILQTASATAGASATPVATPVAAPAVVRDVPQTRPATFTLRCDRAGTHTFTLGAEVRPASALDTDPNASNNVRQTTVTVNCTPCLHATQLLNLKDDTLVSSGEVLGGTSFELGAQQATVTGNVFVRGNALLRSTATINGNLTLFGTLQTQGAFTVTGTTLQNTAVTILPIPTKTIPIGTLDLTVPLNGVQTWAPGTYDEANVLPNGEARLSAGTYNFRRMTLAPDTDLVLNTTGGNILINARDFADVGDRTRFLKSGTGKVFVHTNSTGIVRIGVDVEHRASIRAPQAILNVFSDTVFEGCVAARRITFEPQVSLLQPTGAGAP